MSIRQENRKKNIRGLLITVVAILVLTAVGLAVVASQNDSAFKQKAEGFYYSAGDGSVYAKVGNGFAVASSSELQVFGADGVQTLQKTYIMSDPAMSSGGENTALFDIGGESVMIFNAEAVVKNISTDGRVVSAKVNDNGWTAVCCEETGYQGAVYVYNDKGNIVFKWLSGSGYILSACISQSNEYLAVITVGQQGARLVKLKLAEEAYKQEYLIENELVLDVYVNDRGDIYAISDENLYLAKNDEVDVLYNFSDMKLTDYSFGENMLLALNEHRSGGVCVLLKIDPSGEAEEIASYENGIVSMDAGNKHISVLTDTGLFIYDTKKFEMTAYYEVSACLKVLMYEDGTAAAASRNSAAVYSVKNDEASNRKGK